MPDDDATESVLTALRNAEPEPMTAEAVAYEAVDEQRDVSRTDVEDALRELTQAERIEKLKEDDLVRYRAK